MEWNHSSLCCKWAAYFKNPLDTPGIFLKKGPLYPPLIKPRWQKRLPHGPLQHVQQDQVLHSPHFYFLLGSQHTGQLRASLAMQKMLMLHTRGAFSLTVSKNIISTLCLWGTGWGSYDWVLARGVRVREPSPLQALAHPHGKLPLGASKAWIQAVSAHISPCNPLTRWTVNLTSRLSAKSFQQQLH